MKKTIITLASTFVAAGLVKALPHSYLDVGDNFKVGDQPFNEKPDNRNNYKVLVIATKMRKGQSRVLLTKPAAKPAQEAVQDSAKEAAQVSRAKDKGFEFIRGKSKVDELSHEAANREAFEEGERHFLIKERKEEQAEYLTIKTTFADYTLFQLTSMENPT
jgi:hypothetical protein